MLVVDAALGVSGLRRRLHARCLAGSPRVHPVARGPHGVRPLRHAPPLRAWPRAAAPLPGGSHQPPPRLVAAPHRGSRPRPPPPRGAPNVKRHRVKSRARAGKEGYLPPRAFEAEAAHTRLADEVLSGSPAPSLSALLVEGRRLVAHARCESCGRTLGSPPGPVGCLDAHHVEALAWLALSKAPVQQWG